jgi:tetratricopeptide (TPR) repeat protein
MDRSALIATFAILSLAVPPARAQDDTGDERARTHFESGRSYFDEGNYERALEEFQRTLEMSGRPQMYFNIGTTLERLGRLREAADAFEHYLRDVENPPNAELLSRRVEHLRRRAAAQDEGRADPGAEPVARDDSTLVGGAIALGIAGAALVSFAITGSLVLAEDGNLRDGCADAGTCTPSDVRTLEALAIATDVAWPIAAVAGAVGAILLGLGLSREGPSVAPLVAPNAFGILVEGTL